MSPEDFLDDYELLRRTARETGFETISARRVLWPALVHVHPSDPPAVVCKEPHQQRDQVAKDVNRSMFLVEPALRPRLREKLSTLINCVLDAEPDLSYYQGFHDVVTVVLLVCKKVSVATAVVHRLACSMLRPNLGPNLREVTALLDVMIPMVEREDAELAAFLRESGVQPYFALPWLLTWFSHSLSDFDLVMRIFDVVLGSDGLFPFHLAVAIVLWTKPHLMREVECEYAAVHSFFSHSPTLLSSSMWMSMMSATCVESFQP